jgi:hypothetical protein
MLRSDRRPSGHWLETVLWEFVSRIRPETGSLTAHTVAASGLILTLMRGPGGPPHKIVAGGEGLRAGARAWGVHGPHSR